MRLDYYIFGYRSFTVSEENKASAASALLRRNLCAKIKSDGSFAVPLYRTRRYKRALANSEYTQSEIKGLPSFFVKYKERYGIIIGLMLALVYIILASRFVWTFWNHNAKSLVSW